MKKVYLVKMSLDSEQETERILNEAIKKYSGPNVTWLPELSKPLDSDKFMLVADVDSEVGDGPSMIGVKVIRGSQDMKETEEIINTELLKMDMDNSLPKSFYSISHPSEFSYIVLYECKSSDSSVRVLITSNPADAYAGSIRLTKELNDIEEREELDFQPYDSFMIDKENLMILFQD